MRRLVLFEEMLLSPALMYLICLTFLPCKTQRSSEDMCSIPASAGDLIVEHGEAIVYYYLLHGH